MNLYMFCTAIIVREIHDFPQILCDGRFVLIIYIVHDDRLSYIRNAKLNHSFNVIPKICDKDICITFEMKETVLCIPIMEVLQNNTLAINNYLA